jgi:hypothetical protein
MKTIVASILFLSLPFFASSQDIAVYLKEKGKRLDKNVNVYKTGKGKADGTGSTPYFEAMDGLPKRVGLISFYIDDPKEGAYEHEGLPDKSNYYANQMRDEVIRGIAAELAKNGGELVLPKDFEGEAYKNFVPVLDKKSKESRRLIELADEGAFVTASGFKMIPMANIYHDHELEVQLGKLAKDLGLDAVAIVAMTIYGEKKDVLLQGINYALIGPNPVEGDASNEDYQEGMIYSGAIMEIPETILLARLKKGKVISEDYAGVDQFLQTMIAESYARMGKYEE